ncbi:unnamed protein product [Linum trigynum]|uniref:Uncharacterized protein n=1 Tax=Linum trigynum TaxID=586398 RepID=A0AAV2FJ91_9ROSI
MQFWDDLAGVKNLDVLDKVIEGGAFVLTLKDQSILADGYINGEVDGLENVKIGEQKCQNEAYKARKKPMMTSSMMTLWQRKRCFPHTMNQQIRAGLGW